MTTSPATPAWAVLLIHEICHAAQVAPPTRLTWRRRQGERSTGMTRRQDGLIALRAGSDERDQRLTLLHELTHWLVPAPRPRRGRSIHHGRTFYALAFELYARHGVAAADALASEAARYPSVLRHAAALGVPGAMTAFSERRAAVRARPRRRWRVAVPEHAVRLERDGRWTVCTVCRQRIVGPVLASLRRGRRPARHVLMVRS